MGIWKKALSASLTAAMLASVVATSAFAATSTLTTGSDQTNWLNCSVAYVATPDSCQQAAGGGTVTLTGEGTLVAPNADATTGTSSLLITVSGATVISATGHFSASGNSISTTPVALASSPTALTSADTITLWSAAAGTATVTVTQFAASNGVSSAGGTLSVTFFAGSTLAVSTANSIVKTVESATTCGAVTATTSALTGASATGTNPVANLCVLVEDGNGAAVDGTVTATITPVGLLNTTAGTAQTLTATTTSGVASFNIYASGLAGTATITTSVTTKATGLTTSFAPVTFTFSGAPSSLTFSQSAYAVGEYTAGTKEGWLAGTAVLTDASGHALACPTTGGAFSLTSGTGTVFPSGTSTNGFTVEQDTSSITTCDVKVPAPLPNMLGSDAYTLAWTPTSGTAITAKPFTVYASGDVATVTPTFSAATITPGAAATITITAVDSAGRPVADGSAWTLLVSAGAITASASTSSTTTVNGKATVTYLAPFNTGTVSALASVTTKLSSDVSATTVSGTGSANIGTPAPVVGTATNASALGVTKVGPYTTATKVPGLGKYVTFKMSFGAAAAGQHVSILMASKSASGVWSTFAVKTARIADANGDVYFYWRSASAAWLSVRGSLNGTLSNAVQARWR